MKNILKKLNELSKKVNYLQKDKHHQQGYNYVSEAKIKETFKKELEEAGVVFNYSVIDVREYEISPTKNGTKQFCTVAKGDYSFQDTESGESLFGCWAGTGTDTGDKGLYKAITGGIKYIFNTTFLIPTGDDPENENGEIPKATKPVKTPNTPKPEKSPTDNIPGVLTGTLSNIIDNKKTAAGKPYIQIEIDTDGQFTERMNVFSQTAIDELKALSGKMISIDYKQNGKYKDFIGLHNMQEVELNLPFNGDQDSEGLPF